ncbi:Gfo/Idh/MocA family protein [Paenibacillus sp. sgz5001063]|uniref:Gfo/Idh/MocA family protein n=1 Tax=Paenibacillus sp. sgz5001063 TaxID=3242474 RepID=UPI0036D2B401
MSTIGAAIIGCGAIAPLHAKAILSLDGARLIAVADSDPEHAAQAALDYGCEAVTDYKQLIGRTDISIIHICTPHHLHASMAVEFLQAGHHVLTEKPMAMDVPSARRMQEAAAVSKGQLGIVFQNRYNEASIRIKEIIDSRILGQLLCMKGIVTWSRSEDYYTQSSWRGKWSTEGGGVLINQTIHTLDLLQWFGGEITSIKGSVTTDVLNEVIEVEDTAHACILFKDNIRGIFYGTNAYSVNSPVEMEVVFELGTLLLRRDCLYLWKDGQETLLCEPTSTAAEGKSYWGNSHKRLIHDFYRHISEGRKFWIDGNEGIKALKVIAGIYQSSESRLCSPVSSN